MASGAKVHESVMEKYNEVKNRSYSYVLFKMNDKLTEIIVDKAAPNYECGLEELKDDLPKDEPRYALFDYRYTKGEVEGKRDRLMLIAWSPDTSAVKKKMVYASSLDYLVKALKGVKKMQANELCDLDDKCVHEKAESK